jgi:hypothetical protein
MQQLQQEGPCVLVLDQYMIENENILTQIFGSHCPSVKHHSNDIEPISMHHAAVFALTSVIYSLACSLSPSKRSSGKSSLPLLLAFLLLMLTLAGTSLDAPFVNG